LYHERNNRIRKTCYVCFGFRKLFWKSWFVYGPKNLKKVSHRDNNTKLQLEYLIDKTNKYIISETFEDLLKDDLIEVKGMDDNGEFLYGPKEI